MNLTQSSRKLLATLRAFATSAHELASEYSKRVKLGLMKFSTVKVVSLVSIITGLVMLSEGFVLIFLDLAVATSSTLSQAALFWVQTLQQVIGFPLPSYGFNNNSNSAIGIATCIIGFDLLMVSFGLFVRSKIARWIATAIFGLATFFDFTLFLLQGLLGAPASLPGILINGLFVYILLKDHEWFSKELTLDSTATKRKQPEAYADLAGHSK